VLKGLLAPLAAGFLVLLAASCFPLFAQSAPCPTGEALMAPSNPAYADAMELVRRLESHDFTVKCIFPTKLSSVFMVEENGVLRSTVEGEACFSTNYGGIEVVLLPKPQTFADFKITEHRKGGGYLYRFTGTPRVWAGDKFKFGTAGRQHFLKHGNYLFIVDDDQLFSRLEGIFGPLPPRS
jgi:hypothetical protein